MNEDWEMDFSVRKGSMAHNILLITRFYRRNVNIKDLAQLNTIFETNRPSVILRVVDRLARQGLVEKHTKETWSITPKGIRFLYKFAYNNRKNLVEA